MCQVLDKLGQIPWKVNNRVLETIEYVWSIGGGLSAIPNRYNAREVTPQMIKEASFGEKLKLLKEHQQNCEAQGLRCSFLLALKIAQAFRHCHKLYFPHNCDFRGRVYPICPHLNHMGADLNRGILTFSEGKRLGEDGLWWLKVHFANKWGKDKLPLD